MIITRRQRIPRHWILVAVLPWAALTFQNQVMGTAFTFSLAKFIDNPASIAFILSLPAFLSSVLAPLVNLLSDRIWTRFGRRKPFIVPGFLGMYLGITGMAIAPSATVLIACYVLFSLGSDCSSPIEPLKQEVVPPHQRGVSTALMQWISNLSSLLFFTIMLGRFDEVNTTFLGIPLTGEAASYGACIVLGLSMLMLLMLGIRESDPRSPLRGQGITVRNLLGGLVDGEFRLVYLLIFASAILWAGLGPLAALLQTEQFGITKQQLGLNVAVGVTLNLLVFIPLFGWFADRLNRMRTYQILIVLVLINKLVFYIYVEHIVLDHRICWQEQVIFGEAMSVCSILCAVVFTPLVYDYVRRDKMGSYAAGANVISRLTGIITLNGVGLFVWAYSSIWCPPAGQMVRVVATAVQDAPAMAAALARGWPADAGPVPQVRTWRATGLDLERSAAFELRQADPASAQLVEERKRLQAEAASGEGTPSADLVRRRDAAKDRIAAIDADLARRAGLLRDMAQEALGDGLLQDGAQIRQVRMAEGTLLVFALDRQPDRAALEQDLEHLRAIHPEVIDLRPRYRDGRYSVEVALAVPPVATEALAREVQAALAAGQEDLRPSEPRGQAVRIAALDLQVIEDPRDLYASPLKRWIIHPILARFDQVPGPQQRLRALGRTLRLDGATPAVRCESIPGVEDAIQVVAVLEPGAPTEAVRDAAAARLDGLAPDASPGVLRAWYGRIVAAGDVARLAIARPVLAADYAPLRYDYMSGYLLLFVLTLVGLLLTCWFRRLEARGLIRPHGREEAQAEQRLQERCASAPELGHAGTYTPGRWWPKLILACFGAAMMAHAAWQLWQPLRLTITGERATAVAVRILKRGHGQELAYADPVAASLAEERRDRAWHFFTEFEYGQGGQRAVLPVGSQLRPIFPLIDEAGLPSATTVGFDPQRPGEVVFPALIATWYLPAFQFLFGCVSLLGGSLLAWHARRPIPLPAAAG